MVKPSRREKIQLLAKVDCTDKASLELAQQVLEGCGKPRVEGANDGDTLNLDYTVFCDYFGEVAENLERIIKIREAGVPVKVEASELNHGRSLLAEVLCHLDTIYRGSEK